VFVDGALHHFAFTPASLGSITAGTLFSLSAALQDSANNALTFDNSTSVTVTVSAGAGSLSTSSATLMAVNGVVSWSDLRLTKAQGGYKLKLTAGSVNTETAVFDITRSFFVRFACLHAQGRGGAKCFCRFRFVSSVPNAPLLTSRSAMHFECIAATAHHLIATTPSTTTRMQAFTVTVTLQDAYNNICDGAAGSITVSRQAGPSADLQGTLTHPLTSGSATFADLTLSKAGSGYVLGASCTSGDCKDMAVNTTAFSINGLRFCGHMFSFAAVLLFLVQNSLPWIAFVRFCD
jgi:hypothetical protein